MSAEALTMLMAGSSGDLLRDTMPLQGDVVVRPMLPTPRTLPERPPGIEPFTGPSAWTPREFPKMGDESPPMTPPGQTPGSSLHQLIQPPMTHPGKAPPENVIRRRREESQEAAANSQNAEAANSLNAEAANSQDADAPEPDGEASDASNPWWRLN